MTPAARARLAAAVVARIPGARAGTDEVRGGADDCSAGTGALGWSVLLCRSGWVLSLAHDGRWGLADVVPQRTGRGWLSRTADDIAAAGFRLGWGPGEHVALLIGLPLEWPRLATREDGAQTWAGCGPFAIVRNRAVPS